LPSPALEIRRMSTVKPTATEIPATRRHAWIAEAAYFLAERRGFQGGCPLEDWLRVERVFHQHDARSLPPPRLALVFLERRPAGDGYPGP
jgi:hypothetical protein